MGQPAFFPPINMDKKMKKKLLNCFSLFVIFALMGLVHGCGESKTPEQLESAAKGIYDEADMLWKTGKEKAALPLYDKIANEYPETEVAKDLEGELRLKNLFFGSTAGSWTNIRLYELENLLTELYMDSGEYPGALETGMDAWDTRIKIKFVNDADLAFDFLVMSAGPDKQFDTPDDLILVHAKNKRAGRSVRGQRSGAGGMPQEITLDNIETALDGIQGEFLDKEVGLNELENSLGTEKKGAKKVPGEKEIELDDLLQGNF